MKAKTNEWWQRHLAPWDATIAVAYALGLVMAWSSSWPGTGARLGSSALLLGMFGWWRWSGRPLVLAGDEAGWRGRAYLLGVLALFVPTAFLVPDCSWILFGLCPQPYMMRPYRTALVWVGALNAVPPLSVLVHPHTAGGFWGTAAIAVAATAFSQLMGVVITRIATQSEERAALISELEDSRSLIATLSHEAGVTAERERLAAEIHDTLAQGFASILTLVHAARSMVGEDSERVRRHLDLAAETARENLAEARALVDALAPAALDTRSLTEALSRQAGQVAEECGMDVEFGVDGDLGQLSTRLQVVLLRAAQEGLANVRRHSGAKSSTVRLSRDERVVSLVVADDGVGFDPDAPASGFGLRGMRARVEQIGGTLLIDSGQAGTTVRVEVPA